MKLDPYIKSFTKTNSDSNVRPETMNLLIENIRIKQFDMSLGNDFLHMIPKAQAKKKKKN